MRRQARLFYFLQRSTQRLPAWSIWTMLLGSMLEQICRQRLPEPTYVFSQTPSFSRKLYMAVWTNCRTSTYQLQLCHKEGLNQSIFSGSSPNHKWPRSLAMECRSKPKKYKQGKCAILTTYLLACKSPRFRTWQATRSTPCLVSKRKASHLEAPCGSKLKDHSFHL